MSHPEPLTLRPVGPADLDFFYKHQLDPEAVRMAGFVGRNRPDRSVFDAHWTKILQAPQNLNRTIVAGGQVAGYVACFPLEGNREIAFWLGREFWGRGLATQALARMLQLVVERPIFAHVVADNPGSLRVLQKCGFAIIGKNQDGDTVEYTLRLDPSQTPRHEPR